MKLDIGCGLKPLDGYEGVDLKLGKQAFPLDYPDNSIDEIRAVHILEHFSYYDTPKVLAEWVRVLKPGAIIRISVPDFSKLVDIYNGENIAGVPIEQIILGAQEDANDKHLAIFNPQKLAQLMMNAGLGDLKPWQTTSGDTASLPISLNIQGTKGAPNPPPDAPPPFKVSAVMSTPRLAFMDNSYACVLALMAHHIPLHKFTGAFWGQCLERSMELVSGLHKPDAILTIDYDSVFSADDVGNLIKLMQEHPEADAICAMQISRGGAWPLLTKYGEDGKRTPKIAMTEFDADLTEICTGHFGLTLIRTDKLLAMPHPWFLGEPNIHGKWDEGRIDDDIYFWNKWEKMGYKLFHANRVPIGHCELYSMWPGFGVDEKVAEETRTLLPSILDGDKLKADADPAIVKRLAELIAEGRYGVFKIINQKPADFWEQGKPEGCWK